MVTPAVIMAAVCSCGEAVCDLIKAGAYPAHVIGGDVTLHVCAENNLEEAVAMIVGSEHGASLALKRTAMGNTPIELATCTGRSGPSTSPRPPSRSRCGWCAGKGAGAVAGVGR